MQMMRYFYSKSPVHLQDMLNKLHGYSQIWGLQVNTSKTKIMIYEKDRPTSTEFYYNNTLLKYVENFKYLGVKFIKMVVGIEHRNAYRSMALLLCITYIDYSKMSHSAPKRSLNCLTP